MPGNSERFKWHPNEPSPEIQPHSKAKLKVLRRYLRAYFDRLNVNPQREEFRLDLVDGFAGGGTFLDRGDVIPGSPLIMLEEARSAQIRLNERKIKKLNMNCKFYFIDKEKLTRTICEKHSRSAAMKSMTTELSSEQLP